MKDFWSIFIFSCFFFFFFRIPFFLSVSFSFTFDVCFCDFCSWTFFQYLEGFFAKVRRRQAEGSVSDEESIRRCGSGGELQKGGLMFQNLAY